MTGLDAEGSRPRLWRLHRIALATALPILLSQAAGCAARSADPAPQPTLLPLAAIGPTPSASLVIAAKPSEPKTRRPATTPSPSCSETKGRIEEASYRGVAAAGDLPYRIYLPPCYDQIPGEFAALYLLHGYPFDESQWIDLGAIGVVEELILSGARAPFLVVLPRQPEPLFRGSDGGPGSYEQEFLEGLLPAVESKHRAQSSPAGRAVAGLSRGGVWALEISFRNPMRFIAAGAMSPALAVNYARDPYDPFWLAKEQQQLPGRIVLLAGEEDWSAPGMERLKKLLDERGAQPIGLSVPGGHESSTWQTGMERFISLLTEDWGRKD